MAYDVEQLTLLSSPLGVTNYAISKTLIVNITSELEVFQYWWRGKRGRDGDIRKPVYNYSIQFNNVTIHTFRLSDLFSSQVRTTATTPPFQHRITPGTTGAYRVFINQLDYLDRSQSWAVQLEIKIKRITATFVGLV